MLNKMLELFSLNTSGILSCSMAQWKMDQLPDNITLNKNLLCVVLRILFSMSEEPVQPAHETLTRNENSSTERNVRNGKKEESTQQHLLLLDRN